MYALYIVLKNGPYVMNGLEDIKAWKWMKTNFVQFLACYSKASILCSLSSVS